jgi:hypothetical protein
VHVSNGPAQHLLLDEVIKELLKLEIENPMQTKQRTSVTGGGDAMKLDEGVMAPSLWGFIPGNDVRAVIGRSTEEGIGDFTPARVARNVMNRSGLPNFRTRAIASWYRAFMCLGPPMKEDGKTTYAGRPICAPT